MEQTKLKILSLSKIHKILFEQKVIAYIIIAVAALLVFYAGTNFLKQNYFGENYQKALDAQGEDKCKAPEGYTEQEWKEHMGHHPEQYEECLK